MTPEQFLNETLGFIAAWGPAAIVAAVIFFLIVAGIAVSIIVFTFRQMRKMGREHDEMSARMTGRGRRR